MELTSDQQAILAKIEQDGTLQVEDADDMNVPVNIFISEPDESPSKGKFWCYADNFMPRKGCVDQCAYQFYAPDRETAKAVVRLFWLPLYEAAVTQLNRHSTLYYWEVEEDEKEKLDNK